jgi:glycine dehydrogenase
MMRFLRKLADKDLALDRAMIPLGSCTMKLNAAAEMMPVSWDTVANLHPFAPKEHAEGYRAMFDDLEAGSARSPGSTPSAAAECRQPGRICRAAGDPALSRIARRRSAHVCLIPSSAHGTNPASAHVAGLDVVVVKCTESAISTSTT